MIRLDGDGNTQGLIIGSNALESHMVNGGPRTTCMALDRT